MDLPKISSKTAKRFDDTPLQQSFHIAQRHVLEFDLLASPEVAYVGQAGLVLCGFQGFNDGNHVITY